jgi:hypothetical protein
MFLPILHRLSVQDDCPIVLEKEKPSYFKKELQRSVKIYAQQYQPRRGRRRERNMFGEYYFLTSHKNAT